MWGALIDVALRWCRPVGSVGHSRRSLLGVCGWLPFVVGCLYVAQDQGELRLHGSPTDCRCIRSSGAWASSKDGMWVPAMALRGAGRPGTRLAGSVLTLLERPTDSPCLRSAGHGRYERDPP